MGKRLELRSIRATGRSGGKGPIPPAPAGFTLELAADGSFSLSIDEHERLVTGTVSRQEDAATMWLLQPTEPDWTTSRPVRATVIPWRFGYSLDNTVGQP